MSAVTRRVPFFVLLLMPQFECLAASAAVVAAAVFIIFIISILSESHWLSVRPVYALMLVYLSEQNPPRRNTVILHFTWFRLAVHPISLNWLSVSFSSVSQFI